MLCRNPKCKQPLIEIPINGNIRLACNNDRCHLFREGQGCVLKETEEVEGAGTIRWLVPRQFRASNSAYNMERNKNYHLLRSLEVPPLEARAMTSRRQTRIYLEQNGYHTE